MENSSMTIAPPPAVCNNKCHKCCSENIEEINAASEAALRNRSLTLSSVVTVLILGAHTFFAYVGKQFVIPDIVWVIILAPWGGASIGKITDFINGIRKK